MTTPKREHLLILPEPRLEMAYGQRVNDPRDGLALFGPWDLSQAGRPTSISYGLIGTPSGMAAFKAFVARWDQPIVHDSNQRLWPTFPGFEAAFHCKWPTEPTHVASLDETDVLTATQLADPHARAAAVVQAYTGAIERFMQSDRETQMAVCVVPDIVFTNCRTKSTVRQAVGTRPSRTTLASIRAGQDDLFEKRDFESYAYSVDFRRQIKARVMAFNKPIQIIRESTLRVVDSEDRKERGLTPLTDRAWNLATTMYYKAGGQPWKLADARPGVCYVGITFRKTEDLANSPSACCAAQMFLDTGDGVVFRGQNGRWYSPERHAFHLSKEAAQALMSGLLQTYRDQGGQPLKEIFLHCHSGLDKDEFEGYAAAAGPDIKVIGVRVRVGKFTRLFRQGRMPVLRGSFWQAGERDGYLWGSGFKPRLGTYDGSEVPLPLEISLQYGQADMKQVAADILALSKLNYNAARLGESEPVTIKFSDTVGEILVSNPLVTNPSAKFKMYI